jgi:CBS domain-containing protein
MIENVVTENGDLTLREAIRTLYERHVGALVIIDEEENCEGIFTERDAFRSIANEIPLDNKIKDHMSKNVMVVRDDASFAEARKIMIAHKIRRLPVVNEENKIIGIATFRRILDELLGMPTVKS